MQGQIQRVIMRELTWDNKAQRNKKGLGTKGYGTEDAKRDHIKRKVQNVGVEVQVLYLRLWLFSLLLFPILRPTQVPTWQ